MLRAFGKIIKYFLLLIAIILLILVIFVLSLGYYLDLSDKLEKVDAVVVISGGGMERIEQGLDLMQADYADYLILSGDAYDDSTSNAASMRAFALAQGLASSQVILEEEADNTYENAYYVNDILTKENFDKIILVTSSYHQRRAYKTFRKVLEDEIEIINAPAKPNFWESSTWWKDEKSKHLALTEIVKIIYTAFSGNYGQN